MSNTLKFKRIRTGRTNYRTRLRMLLSKRTRLVVRPTHNDVVVQLVDYGNNGDQVRVTVRASHLESLGWPYATGNLPAAYLCGFWAASLAKKHKISQAIVDMGEQISVKGSRIYAVVKGARDAGLKVPCDAAVLPSESRVRGEHIAAFASMAKEPQFTNVKKAGADLSKMPSVVDEVKKKIGGTDER